MTTNSSLWEKYCSLYEESFPEQMDYNRKRMKLYFQRWKKTALAKSICRIKPKGFKEVPITTYSDYPVLSDFGRRISRVTDRNPRKKGELFSKYYDRIGEEIGHQLDPYMTEPYFFCTKTTGTTGESKWIAHGETFWKNFFSASIAAAVISCSDDWGETKLRTGDKALNMNAPIPYISGWGALASQTEVEMIPTIEVADNLRDMKERFSLVLRTIEKGARIALGGGIGSIFYMICKYFSEPEVFYREYYTSMGFGLRKILLSLKLLQHRYGKKVRRSTTDLVPLKGVLVAGMEAQLYIEFFKEEFNLDPLHIYGSTETGPLMRGDPDRKTDLVPDLRTSYIELRTEDGDMRDLDELKRGEVYNVVVTPFGSTLFRYDMEDLSRVVDFRDDGMPVFAFEGRKTTVVRLYDYDVTPNTIVQALSRAGLKSSDKWAVVKLLKPREHLHFLMERTWPYSEAEAENIIFNSLLDAERTIPHPDETLLRDYVTDFRIKKPSEVIRVEYLKPGAFLRYQMMKAKGGSPIGQYKPPKIIPSERMEIYEALKNA